MSRIPEEVLVLSEARWWIAVPSEVSPIDISDSLFVLHRCHLSQQSTWIPPVPFVKMKSWHWMYSSATDPDFLSPWNTQCSLSLCLHCVSWADPADERQTCLWPPVLRIVSEVMALFTFLSALCLSSRLFSSPPFLSLPLTSVQPCPICRKLSGSAVCLFKIAYMAGSCKRRPGNTSQQCFWFSSPHGLLFLLDLWTYI